MRALPVLALLVAAAPSYAASTPADPPLTAAVKAGDLDGLKAALASGAAVGDKDAFGWTAAMWAVKGGNAAMVQALLDKGADLKPADPPGFDAMIEASKGGRADVVALLAKRGFSCRAKDATGTPAVAYAASQNTTATVAALLACKARVDERDAQGATALIRAAQLGAKDMVAYLLAQGAKPDARDGAGYTALMWAAHAGRADVAKALLAKGADPAVAGKDGRTRASDLELVARAHREGRVFLTRDRRIPAVAGVTQVVLGDARVERQLAETFAALRIAPDPSRWFTRCALCNAPLETLARETALPLVPPKARALDTVFRRCGACARVYWDGTHVARAKEKLARWGFGPA
ncbi:MAG: ankyrin repeat domain-containing protein [Elusimicrobia bacterium]|nr:ankyrin repeat domain-containing protein [Elusimicrobiota bacterium]